MRKIEVQYGRIAGIEFSSGHIDGVCFLVWNQWRSGAKSLFSKHLAEQLLKNKNASSVICLDRIASGGMSENNLSKTEQKNMKNLADLQFTDEYYEAVGILAQKYREIVIDGSSGGTLAVQSTLVGLHNHKSTNRKVSAIMVEPTGIRPFGIFGNKHTSVAHGFLSHIVAYRHRVRRGWWTPMDKEQYFAKGKLLEKRGMYISSGESLDELLELLRYTEIPIDIYLSENSHMHRDIERNKLNNIDNNVVRVHIISGNHDKICQPISLAKLYLNNSRV